MNDKASFYIYSVCLVLAGFLLALYQCSDTKADTELCRALQLKTCNAETVRQAFAAADYRTAELERALAQAQERITAMEAISIAESRFKPESNYGRTSLSIMAK